MKMELKTKEGKGITLIALVITIIVLLILAAVTIVTLTGENGILTKAGYAQKENVKAEERDQIGLAYNAVRTEKLSKGESGNVSADDLKEALKANGKDAEVTSGTDEEGAYLLVTMTKTRNKYKVRNDGKIENVDSSEGSTGGDSSGENAGGDSSEGSTGGDSSGENAGGDSSEGGSGDGPLAEDGLNVGDYVYYPDKNGNKILCKVLYNNENYGVQLVALNPVDTVTLGYDDPTIPSSMASESNFEKAKYSYNNAIKTLNDKADEYRNESYTDEGGARCVGSVPNDPYSEASDYFTHGLPWIYHGEFKNGDDNYNEDWNQLGTISTTESESNYWLASRVVKEGSGPCFSLRSYPMSGPLSSGEVCWLRLKSPSEFEDVPNSCSLGLRPVFRLKSNVKLDNSNGKDGTAEDKAYDLQ